MTILPLILAALFNLTLQEEIKVTRWMSPDGSKPISFKEWQATREKTIWQVKQLYPLIQNKQSFDFAIIVEDILYDSLQNRLMQLKDNIEIESGTVIVSQASGGKPSDLKTYLQSISGLQGALLIGDLPIAWYQLLNYWEHEYEEFPCDLYFMDLDGTWLDDSIRYDYADSLIPGSDSIFDGHTGDDVAPEIFVGRLFPSTIGDPVSLLQNYFHKDNNYRRGFLCLPDTALVYVDDDWAYWIEWDSSYVQLLYPFLVLVTDSETTIADDYRNRVQERRARAWVSLFAHSWSGGHGFIYDNYTQWSYFYGAEIPGIDPDAFFYNLFCCSNCRFVEYGYCGGRYIFTNTYGLGSIGSTKTGAMLEFYPFYNALAGNLSMGEAFRDWFDCIALYGFDDYERSWHYGMTLLGDPFLKPTGHHSIPISVVINEVYYDSPQVDTRTFTELFGVPGTLLDLFWLFGVNGVNGTIYRKVALSGNVIPGDSFFVIAQDTGVSNYDAIGDVNWQNGPDNIWLVHISGSDTIIIDRVGYGEEDTTSWFFMGEGLPTEDVAPGHSTGRYPDGWDTHYNLNDFVDFSVPTPGESNQIFYRDVGVDTILAPSDTVYVESTYTPRVRIVNSGDLEEIFDVVCEIGVNYSDTNSLSLNPAEDSLLEFREWLVPASPATYQMRVYTLLSEDEDPSNNEKVKSITSVITGVAEFTSLLIFSLGEITPNPGIGEMKIQYSLPAASTVRLRIYDVTGRIVKMLVRQRKEPGRYTTNWNRRDENGNIVSAGMYFIDFEAGNYRDTKKFILLK